MDGNHRVRRHAYGAHPTPAHDAASIASYHNFGARAVILCPLGTPRYRSIDLTEPKIMTDDRLPLQDFINQIARMADLHMNQLWALSMKEAAERLQDFQDIEDMLS